MKKMSSENIIENALCINYCICSVIACIWCDIFRWVNTIRREFEVSLLCSRLHVNGHRFFLLSLNRYRIYLSKRKAATHKISESIFLPSSFARHFIYLFSIRCVFNLICCPFFRLCVCVSSPLLVFMIIIPFKI